MIIYTEALEFEAYEAGNIFIELRAVCVDL